MTIAIADDDINFLEALEVALRQDYRVKPCRSLKELSDVILAHPPDLLICDFDFGPNTLPEFLRSRADKIPVIVLTGVASKKDVIDLLNLGVSGFLEKPVKIAELLEKIGIFKELAKSQVKEGLKKLGVFTKNSDRIVEVDGKDVTLTPLESKILFYFAGNIDRKINRTDLHTHLWPKVHVADNTLDTHLVNLKKKIPKLKETLVSSYGGTIQLRGLA